MIATAGEYFFHATLGGVAGWCQHNNVLAGATSGIIALVSKKIFDTMLTACISNCSWLTKMLGHTLIVLPTSHAMAKAYLSLAGVPIDLRKELESDLQWIKVGVIVTLAFAVLT